MTLVAVLVAAYVVLIALVAILGRAAAAGDDMLDAPAPATPALDRAPGPQRSAAGWIVAPRPTEPVVRERRFDRRANARPTSVRTP